MLQSPLLLQASPQASPRVKVLRSPVGQSGVGGSRQRRLIPSTQLIWVGQCSLQPPRAGNEHSDREPASQIDVPLSARGNRHGPFLGDPLGGILDLPQFRARVPRDPAPVASKIYSGTIVKVPPPNTGAFVASGRAASLAVYDPEFSAYGHFSSRVRSDKVGMASNDDGAWLNENVASDDNVEAKGPDETVSAGVGKPDAGAGQGPNVTHSYSHSYARWHHTNGHSRLPTRMPALFTEPYVEKKVSNLVRESRKPPTEDEDSEDELDDDGNVFFYQHQGWLPANKEYDGEVERARRDLRERANLEKERLRQRHEQELRKFQRHQEHRGTLSSFTMKVMRNGMQVQADEQKAEVQRAKEEHFKRQSVMQQQAAKEALNVFKTQKGQARKQAKNTLDNLKANMAKTYEDQAKASGKRRSSFVKALKTLANKSEDGQSSLKSQGTSHPVTPNSPT